LAETANSASSDSDSTRGTPIVIAHRGASAYEPENTLRSIRRALELGAPAVEIDVRRSLDGHLVVMHDETVDRTTKGSGPIAAKTSQEIRSLDAGLGERVPTLLEVIETVGDETLLLIEVKVRGLGPEVVEALRSQGRMDRVLIISFLADEVANVKRMEPGVRAGILFRGAPQHAIDRAASAKVDVIGFRHDALTRDLIRAAHLAGLEVLTWTVDEAALARKVADLGVDYIASNAPDRVLAAVVR